MSTVKTAAFAAVMLVICGMPNSSSQDKPAALPFDSAINEFLNKDKEQFPPAGANLFVGSSSIVRWPHLAASFAPAPVIQRGFGGSTSNQATHYADKIVIPYKPKRIFFYSGENDLFHGSTPEMVADRFKEFVDKVSAALPDVTIYFISIKPSLARENLMPAMEKTNRLVKAFAEERKQVGFVDIYKLMLASDGKPNPDLLVDDKLHMNEKGYEIWSNKIRPLMADDVVTAKAPTARKTYVVDAGDAKASDNNPGTAEAPLKTISAAALKVQPGDTVLVRPGVYRESVNLSVSGKEGAPIVFKSETPHAAVIDGADVVTDVKHEGGGLWSFNDPGLKKHNAGWAPYGNGEWVHMNGSPLERAGSRDSIIPGSFWLDLDAKVVYVMPAESDDMANSTLEYARREGLICPQKPLDDIHVTGFTLTHCADIFRSRAALQITGNRWCVEDNHIRWASFLGICMKYSNNAVVAGNLLEWNGCLGTLGHMNANMIFENNVMRGNNWRRIDPGMEGGGAKFCVGIDSVMRGNHGYCNWGAGLWLDGAAPDALFEDNLMHSNLWGVFSEINWDQTMRGNVCYNNVYGITVGENCAALIHHNICFNNEIGIYLRWFERTGENKGKKVWYDSSLEQWKIVNGLSPFTVERWKAGFMKYVITRDMWMANNTVIWENLVFDNKYLYAEHRDYRKQTPFDAVVNNFSDYNIWYQTHGKPRFNSPMDGDYPDGLAGWRKASGRDANSVEMDPRNPSSTLPGWAAAKRALWDIPLRPYEEIQAMQLGLVDSPCALEVKERLARSSYAKPLPLKDASVKAFVLEVEGMRALALWTTQSKERRYLSLNVGVDAVSVENGYHVRNARKLNAQTVDLAVGFLPVYLLGVGEQISETPGSSLEVQVFNAPGKPVPGKAVLVNRGKSPADLAARLIVSRGFTVEPATITRRLEPGASCEVPFTLTPEATLLKGNAQVRIEATMGDEHFAQIAAFGVGESSGAIAFAEGTIKADGKLDDWGAIVSQGAPAGVIAQTAQIANGDATTWSGPDDLSAKVYAAWTADALCVAVVVKDDTLLVASPGADPWNFDCVELFVDGRSFEMQWQVEPTEGCYQIAVSPAKDKTPSTSQVFRKTMPGLQTGTSLTENGYVIEYVLPLSRENFPAGKWEKGRPIKMSVLVNDKDNPDTNGRDTTLGWAFSKGGTNHGDTSGWQTLVLENNMHK